MFRFVFVLCALSAVLAAPQRNLSASELEEKAEIEKIQNESAHYSFDSSVNDDINDQALQRTETRDGTKVEGSYSYSDGYVRRTVHYVADENGYRIVKEDMEEIGEGPIFNPNGQADISGSQIGQYSIKLDQSDNEKHYKEVKSQ
ncbi:cuticle protein 7 [Eupeodes corollae]|uniref:cuticle protein 7 n=1 Tax=Eupeodes corollae TaxID=290404 RepID=UPI002492AA9F|nr:cuticle protein 7 [Eupeodes corollae]